MESLLFFENFKHPVTPASWKKWAEQRLSLYAVVPALCPGSRHSTGPSTAVKKRFQYLRPLFKNGRTKSGLRRQGGSTVFLEEHFFVSNWPAPSSASLLVLLCSLSASGPSLELPSDRRGCTAADRRSPPKPSPKVRQLLLISLH